MSAHTNRALEVLNANVERIRSGPEWAAALRLRSRLHRYSFSNVLLIHLQCPDATMVAGYRAWQGLGRQVRKGERAISILAPLTRTVEDDDGEKNRIVVGFRAASVFDVGQTDGPPLPEPPRPEPLEGDDRRAVAILDALTRYAASLGCAVERGSDALGQANGAYDPATRRILLATGLAPAQEAKTLVHEIAHAQLHANGAADRARAEVQAESAAFLTMDALGIDSGGYSFHYVAHWAGSTEDLLRAGDAAVRVADELIEACKEGVDTLAHMCYY
jgi:antirestriction protein ArdC